MTLLRQHQDLIDASGISAEVAKARGYRSAETKAELSRLGFTPQQQNVPALLIPLHDVTGERAGYLLRPDEPRQIRGRLCKYEMPKGASMVVDVPPPIRNGLADPALPLYITEGSRKADAAVSRGLVCISLTGVWCWRGTNKYGGKTALPDFEDIALEGREVYVVYDSDVMLKPDVHAALERLAGFLHQRKARLAFVYLPPGEGGTKTGLDDFLAGGRSVGDLHRHASSELRSLEGAVGECPYECTEHGIVWHKSTENGPAPVPLANFTAKIVADLAQDDGVEVEQYFEIEGTLNGRTTRFSLPSHRFMPMGWPIEHLGAGAILEPGQGTKDRTRHAIQTLSGDVPRRTAFGHLGWRCLDGRHYYLHAAGAIGAHEVRRDVEVAVSEALRPFELPDPPRGEELVEAVRATLGMIGVAREEIGYVLLALIGRAPLGHCDSTVWLFGETGSFKSELGALCQQHWGAGLDARHLPASFTATANYIEGLLFMAKDALAVVDDFAPEGSGHDLLRAHREAARVIRAQGNLQARGRMRSDGGLRAVKPPRGLLLGTGEEVPRGHSVRARMLILGIESGDVDTAKLTELQEHARSGVLAASLAGYVEHLAGAYEENHRRAAARIQELRVDALPGPAHRRTPDAVAQLKLGLERFLAYAHEVSAITAHERAALARSGFEALEALGLRQAAHQTSSEPATRFVELLGSAISSGSAHVADPDGAQPANPEAWGWRRIEIAGELTWRAQGTRVGWVDGDDLWLDPDASYGAAQDLARRVADPFTVSRTTLNKRLAERGMLASTDLEKRQCVPVRRLVAGIRRQVLHMKADQLVQLTADTEPLVPGPVGRGGRGPHQEKLPDAESALLPAAPVETEPTDRVVEEPDHSDQLPPASAEDEAEYERVMRKYGVTEEPDS